VISTILRIKGIQHLNHIPREFAALDSAGFEIYLLGVPFTTPELLDLFRRGNFTRYWVTQQCPGVTTLFEQVLVE
jgi:hypothetical protein